MGGFLDAEEQESSDRPENPYVKMPEPDQGKTVEVRMRLLDARPERVFRHWIGPDPAKQRPYNCPSRKAGCLACYERQQAKDAGQDHRDIHKMDKRYLANALVYWPESMGGTKTQIFSFGQKLGDKLDFLHDRHGDLRDYDITVIKRKTGPLKFNIEYDAIYDDANNQADRRKLSDAELSLAEQRHNLKAEVEPAKLEDIAAAVKGETAAGPQYASPDQVAELKKLAAKKKMKLSDLSIGDETKISTAEATDLIAQLAA